MVFGFLHKKMLLRKIDKMIKSLEGYQDVKNRTYIAPGFRVAITRIDHLKTWFERTPILRVKDCKNNQWFVDPAGSNFPNGGVVRGLENVAVFDIPALLKNPDYFISKLRTKVDET